MECATQLNQAPTYFELKRYELSLNTLAPFIDHYDTSHGQHIQYDIIDRELYHDIYNTWLPALLFENKQPKNINILYDWFPIQAYAIFETFAITYKILPKNFMEKKFKHLNNYQVRYMTIIYALIYFSLHAYWLKLVFDIQITELDVFNSKFFYVIKCIKNAFKEVRYKEFLFDTLFKRFDDLAFLRRHIEKTINILKCQIDQTQLNLKYQFMKNFEEYYLLHVWIARLHMESYLYSIQFIKKSLESMHDHTNIMCPKDYASQLEIEYNDFIALLQQPSIYNFLIYHAHSNSPIWIDIAKNMMYTLKDMATDINDGYHNYVSFCDILFNKYKIKPITFPLI